MKNETLPICENFNKKYNEILDLKKQIKFTLRPIEQELLNEELNELLLKVIDCTHYTDSSSDCCMCKSLIDNELKISHSGKFVKLPG